MRLWLLILLLLSAQADAMIFHGGGGSAISPGTTLYPLSGGSLVTPNNGTLTFANSQGWYGHDVLKNGSPMNIEATALGVFNGITYFKYNSLMPSNAASASLCFLDHMTATQTTNSGGSSIGPDGEGATWSWSGTTVLRNGSSFGGITASQMILGVDGNIYMNAFAPHYWLYGYSGGAPYMGTTKPTDWTPGTIRHSATCPAGL